MKSGLVDNMGIAAGITAPRLAVLKLLPLPVSLTAILNFGSRRRRVVSTESSESGMVENMGVEFGIAAPSPTVQKLFPLPV